MHFCCFCLDCLFARFAISHPFSSFVVAFLVRICSSCRCLFHSLSFASIFRGEILAVLQSCVDASPHSASSSSSSSSAAPQTPISTVSNGANLLQFPNSVGELHFLRHSLDFFSFRLLFPCFSSSFSSDLFPSFTCQFMCRSLFAFAKQVSSNSSATSQQQQQQQQQSQAQSSHQACAQVRNFSRFPFMPLVLLASLACRRHSNCSICCHASCTKKSKR